ncbi:hypothetical protein GALMADRAFT_274784 [Galerina marginata CBS 339.88]|uniref:F-box domain-containing protein n=1 Tax=Galerina marginata (strain CBS 339.88) TaxID=685588 RepID=A0A067U1F1_GALM3|nr:hypothetical protein GALMADRAFT_274784 [Galerina marginata CBS 339.88]
MGGTDLHRRYHLCNNTDEKNLCSTCEDIRQLESEIRAAEKHLLSLKDRHHGLGSKFNGAHDPITRKLPLEIISQIFMFFAPHFSSYTTKKRLRLGSICRAWREIAWSTPRLWMSIAIDVCSARKSSVPQNGIDVVNKWLARSGELPLSIFLSNSQQPIETSDLTDAYNMINVINQYSSRWHFLSVDLASEFVPALKGNLHGPSTLNTLKLNHLGRSRTSTAPFQLHVKPSPAVVHLFHIRLKDVDLSWHLANEIVLSQCPLDECIEVMRRATGVTSCRIVNLLRNGGDYPSSAIINVNPFIRELYISPTPESRVPHFLDQMTFPALKKLFLCNGNEAILADPLISFISRSSCHLSTLILADIQFEIDGIIKVLIQAPTLKEFRLLSKSPFGSDTSCLDPFFVYIAASANIRPGERGSFLPNLEFLAVIAPRAFSWTSVPSIMGQYRNDNPKSKPQDIKGYRRPLKTLRLSFKLPKGQTDYIDKDVIPGLLDLIQQGISLQISERLHSDPSKQEDLLKISIAFHGLSCLPENHYE